MSPAVPTKFKYINELPDLGQVHCTLLSRMSHTLPTSRPCDNSDQKFCLEVNETNLFPSCIRTCITDPNFDI